MREKRSYGRVLQEEGVEFEYDASSFPIYNLSSTGFCILTNQPDVFKVGQILEEIRLVFLEEGETTSGQVIHITPYLEEDLNTYMIGIKFIIPENDEEYFRSQYRDYYGIDNGY